MGVQRFGLLLICSRFVEKQKIKLFFVFTLLYSQWPTKNCVFSSRISLLKKTHTYEEEPKASLCRHYWFNLGLKTRYEKYW